MAKDEDFNVAFTFSGQEYHFRIKADLLTRPEPLGSDDALCRQICH